jgi:hypothetical protein
MKYLLTCITLLILLLLTCTKLSILWRATAQISMNNTLTKTINIKADPKTVWTYIHDLSTWPEWAIHNVISSRRGENEYWLMEGPRGVSKVKMNADKTKGILDHDFIDPGEGHWIVFSRVVPGSEGSHFMITFTKPEQMPQEAFEIGMKNLDEELQQLKKILEGGTKNK